MERHNNDVLSIIFPSLSHSSGDVNDHSFNLCQIRENILSLAIIFAAALLHPFLPTAVAPPVCKQLLFFKPPKIAYHGGEAGWVQLSCHFLLLLSEMLAETDAIPRTVLRCHSLPHYPILFLRLRLKPVFLLLFLLSCSIFRTHSWP